MNSYYNMVKEIKNWIYTNKKIQSVDIKADVKKVEKILNDN